MNGLSHVLVVEDSEPLSDAFRAVLEHSGFRVTVVHNISSALLVEESVDVMLLDLTLPDGDGISLLEQMLERGRAPVAAIALTGHDDPETRDRCIVAGCRDVLVKPIPINALVERVRSLLC